MAISQLPIADRCNREPQAQRIAAPRLLHKCVAEFAGTYLLCSLAAASCIAPC